MGEGQTEGFVCSNLSDDLSGLSFKDLPVHSLQDDSVKISIKAASLNFPDLLMTQGKYQNKPNLPFAQLLQLLLKNRQIFYQVLTSGIYIFFS